MDSMVYIERNDKLLTKRNSCSPMFAHMASDRYECTHKWAEGGVSDPFRCKHGSIEPCTTPHSQYSNSSYVCDLVFESLDENQYNSNSINLTVYRDYTNRNTSKTNKFRRGNN
ncbi:hypothetical protein M8J77_013105 [Diaphorina citri]|nr:hypothetical protein M8J77_013105 [Diaphorina citri]